MTISVFPSESEFEAAAVQDIVKVAQGAVRERGVCIMSLAGGETPRRIYRGLGTLPSHEQINWKRVHLVFGDERMVPPDDEQSNFGMVERELLSRVPIPAGNVHRIRGEINPAAAAREYAAVLRSLFASTTDRLDLVLLGAGDDGHTASLFPGTNAVDEVAEPVKDVFVPRLGVWRVTLTFPVINDARRVLFLCAGERKAEIVGRILSSPGPSADLPATMVRPHSGEVTWMLDSAAAASIPR